MIGKLLNKYLSKKLVTKFFDKLSKTNPKLLFAGGIVGMITTLFVSYKKAPAIKDAVTDLADEYLLMMDAIQDGEPKPKVNWNELVMNILKHSSLPILCALLTIGMFTASNQILSKRVAAATGSYALLSKEYTDYREEIKALYGNEVDHTTYQKTQYKKAERLEEGQQAYIVDNEIRVRNTEGGITSCMVTDLYSGIEPEQATTDFINKHRYLTEQFENQGYILLNEVRDLFGVVRIPEGNYLGWAWGDDFQLYWKEMPPVNVMTGELLYDPSVHFLADYELSWTVPTDITDEVRLGKTRA